jgi:transposase
MGPSMSMEGSADTESFGLYMRGVLAPRLEAGQIVVMDNLSVHKSRWVRELIEQRGCQLWHMPSYSPDFNQIEEAFSKVKGLLRRAKARTLQGLFEATKHALSDHARGHARTHAVTSSIADTRHHRSIRFEHCSKRTLWGAESPNVLPSTETNS